MKIAYEYSTPSSEQLTLLGLDATLPLPESDCAVTAYDGDEPIGFGYMRAGAGQSAECCIQVHPSYVQRQIDVNICKLLRARNMGKAYA